MADNYTYLENAGVVVADTADIKERVQQEYKNALGQNLSLEDSTPQGRLIDAETGARTAVVENNALVVNLFNFNMAYGLALDAMGANFGLFRKGATSSRVIATVTGTAGTVIPANSQVSTANGTIFYAENSITIPESNSITAAFLSLEKGAIPCPAGALTKIIDGTFGWETVTNLSSATLGTERESDASFKQKFYDSGLFTGKSLLGDYQSSINKVANVNSSFVYDNYSDEQIVYDTVTIRSNSLYACIDGGKNEDVAFALLNVKSTGCNYSGNTTVQVTEPISGALYTVRFDRPQEIQIYYQITVDKGTAASANLEEAIIQTVLDYSNGLVEGFTRFKVGTNISPFETAAAVNSAVSGITVRDLKAGVSADNLSTSEIEIHINQVARVQAANIQVIIND